jgi:hypothetical protein
LIDELVAHSVDIVNQDRLVLGRQVYLEEHQVVLSGEAVVQRVDNSADHAALFHALAVEVQVVYPYLGDSR